MPNELIERHRLIRKPPGRRDQLAYYQLVGGVTAYLGYDG